MQSPLNFSLVKLSSSKHNESTWPIKYGILSTLGRILVLWELPSNSRSVTRSYCAYRLCTKRSHTLFFHFVLTALFRLWHIFNYIVHINKNLLKRKRNLYGLSFKLISDIFKDRFTNYTLEFLLERLKW